MPATACSAPNSSGEDALTTPPLSVNSAPIDNLLTTNLNLVEMKSLKRIMAQPLAATAGIERKSLQLRAQGGGRPRLLLAEDYDPVRIVTSAMLKGMGCDVEAVVHGEHAVRCASESHYDVIVLDIEMPIMDGITAARSIRRMGGAAGSTPLMALSAFLADSMRAGQWHDTFDIALPKPANRNELHDAVRSALQWQQPIAHAITPELPPVIDQTAYAALRSGIAASIWHELAAVACRDIEVCVNQLEHISPNQFDGTILVFATKLANLGRTFAAPRLAAAAQTVQLAATEFARGEAVKLLLAAGRATVAELRG